MGSDAIVFTKDGQMKSVGMLSRTFLEKTNATEVLVPMVCALIRITRCVSYYFQVSWTEETGEFLFSGDTKEAKFMQNSLSVIYGKKCIINVQVTN